MSGSCSVPPLKSHKQCKTQKQIQIMYICRIIVVGSHKKLNFEFITMWFTVIFYLRYERDTVIFFPFGPNVVLRSQLVYSVYRERKKQLQINMDKNSFCPGFPGNAVT